jgi:signal transduction histidine kinase
VCSEWPTVNLYPLSTPAGTQRAVRFRSAVGHRRVFRGRSAAKALEVVVFRGLTGRMLVASALLAALIGAAFGILLLAIEDQREAAALSRHSQRVLWASNQLERLLIDVETGERGFLLTGEESFLKPWRDGRADFPEVSRRLEELTADGQRHLAGEIVASGDSYIKDYSIPVVEAERRGDASARSEATVSEGKARLDEIRNQFQRFNTNESRIAIARESASRTDSRQAVLAGVVGLTGSVLLIVLFSAYLNRWIVGPVRRAAGMAGRLAGGDLSTRMPETGVGEIGALERSFNEMGGSLERSRDELARLAEEQAALRRVATLVARGAQPDAVFASVTEEVGRLLGVDGTRLMRYERDDAVTVVAAWGDPERQFRAGAQVPLGGANISTQVRETGRPARMDSYESIPGTVAEVMREFDIRSAVGAPIVVEGRIWGLMTALSIGDKVLPAGIESEFSDFTDLVATAIANTHARAELAASRARVVAVTDETRRRIERDLHDGTQQRLVSLALDLRAAEPRVPDNLPQLREEISQAAEALAGALEDLREISRGIHPAILSEAGLKPALKALARRAAVPVELDVHVTGRLPERVEVAAYYLVAEALTNAVKHAEASLVNVEAAVQDGRLTVSVRDDGIGGADPRSGSGLVGLTDRVESLGGTITVVSPPGRGTSLRAELPLDTA